MSDTVVIALTFLIYLLSMAFIGYLAYKKTKNVSDYFLGGRTLGPWVTALSAGASDMSGWLLFALPGMAYSVGVSALWNALGLMTGTYLNWLVVAKRLRVYSHKANDSLTIPAFLSARFNDHSGILRKIAAIFILIFFLIYTSSGLVASGKLFSSVFGMNYEFSVCVGAFAIISYTLFGGFLAVAWTDLVQGLLMSFALAIVPLTIIFYAGGISPTFSSINSIDPLLLDFWRTNGKSGIDIITIVSLLAWGLGYFGQPHILVRFKAISSTKELPQARRIAITWTGFCIIGAIFSGLGGIVHFSTPLDDPEKIYLALVHAVFHPAVAGILLAAILAAIMSTADSQLLVASSALAEDLYKGWFKSNISEKELMNVSRLAVVIVTVGAVLLALDTNNKVLDLAGYAWAGFGAAFGPVLLLSLFWRRMTKNGALAAMLSGGITVLIWQPLKGGIFDLYEILPGFIVASIFAAIFSYLEQPDQDTLKTFDAVVKECKEN